MITLADASSVITLHPDLYWSDEDSWHPVEQGVQRTLSGGLDIQVAALLKGRPITLEPEDNNSAVMPSSVVARLRNWAAAPGKQMTLTLRGQTYTVLFRHQDGGFEARPFVHYRDRVDEDLYHCVIRLMEI